VNVQGWVLLARTARRDVGAAWAQWLAIGLVIALGVAFHGAAWQSYRNLDRSYSESYRRLDFEDWSVSVPDAPRRLVGRVRSLPGVASVEGRLEEDTVLHLPGRPVGKLVGRCLGIPAGRRPEVNNLQLVEGRWPVRGASREALLEASFAKWHGLHPGDWVEIERGGVRVTLRVAGVVVSPEYVYVVKSRQDILPFPDTFGVLWVPDGVLGPLVGRPGRIDALHVRLLPGTSAAESVRAAVALLHGRHHEAPVLREDQPSYQLLRQDVDGFRGYSVLFPMLFLSVAGLTLGTLLTRQVAADRARIGLLRALGFGPRTVMGQVLAGAMLVGALASAAGVSVGAWLGRVFTGFYLSHVSVAARVDWVESATVMYGMAYGLGLTLVSAWWPARQASRIPPADALRPPPPPAGRGWRPDRWIPGLPLLWRFALRNLVRAPRRSLSTLAGVLASMVLLVVAQGLSDTVDSLMGTLVRSVFREDLRVDFVPWTSSATAARVKSRPGVHVAEGELVLPAQFRRGGRTYEAMAVGVEPGARFRDLRDRTGRELVPAGDAVVFGPTLRLRLGLELGDRVDVRLPPSPEIPEPVWSTVRVAGFSDEPVGTVATFSAGVLRGTVGRPLGVPPGAVNVVRVVSDPERRTSLRRDLLRLDGAVSVMSSSDLLEKLEQMMSLMRRFTGAMLLFGMGLSFAVVFNTVTINSLERESEGAALRMLGVGRLSLGGLLLLENLALTGLGVLAGVPVGRWAASQLIMAAQSEEQMDLFAMVPFVRPETPWLCGALVLVTTVVSVVPSAVRLARLDLASSAKDVAR